MVVPQGPFFSAGVRANDVILKINGTSVLGLTHPEVVAALKVAGLQMTVCHTLWVGGSIRVGVNVCVCECARM